MDAMKLVGFVDKINHSTCKLQGIIAVLSAHLFAPGTSDVSENEYHGLLWAATDYVDEINNLVESMHRANVHDKRTVSS